MYGILVQDWIQVRGSAAGTITQSESAWVDMRAFQDVVFWVDISSLDANGGTMQMFLQTAPSKDDILFKTLSNCTLTLTAPITPFNTSSVLPKSILNANPAVPIARWLRWSLTNSATAWRCAFRIFVSATMVAGMSEGM